MALGLGCRVLLLLGLNSKGLGSVRFGSIRFGSFGFRGIRFGRISSSAAGSGLVVAGSASVTLAALVSGRVIFHRVRLFQLVTFF